MATRLKSTNEVANDYNDMILHAVDNIPNAHCVSTAFDGFATETEFVRKKMVAFMNGIYDKQCCYC